MTSMISPSTPLSAIIPQTSMRRSLTLPINKRLPLEGHPPVSDTSLVEETLFYHRSGKIVSFTLPAKTIKPTLNLGQDVCDEPNEVVGTLPWAISTERTLAAGPFSIYTVTGTVSFIRSGRLLHTIFPTSRSWCVDGKTKFILRIRPDSYYRIELPNSSTEDQQTAEDLRCVFAKVSQFELTPCPFKRGFTVDIPDSPRTPVQKRPWKPRNQTEVDSGHQLVSPKGAGERSHSALTPNQIRAQPTFQSAKNNHRILFNQFENNQSSCHSKSSVRPITFSETRAVTAPLQFAFHTTTSSKTDSESSVLDLETASVSSSADSFHSFRSFHNPNSPLPPSPPYSNPPSPLHREDFDLGLDVIRSRQHKRDESDMTAITETFGSSDNIIVSPWSDLECSSTSLLPRTPTLTNDATSQSSEVSPYAFTPLPLKHIRQWQKQIGPRDQSPLPLPANLYSPKHRVSGSHLTTAILQKMCSMLLGPPIQLVALMLNIAAKITNGAFEHSSTEHNVTVSIPCTWELTDDEDDTQDMWDEDDYGIILGKNRGGSWEID